jgi:hypothetical protein
MWFSTLFKRPPTLLEEHIALVHDLRARLVALEDRIEERLDAMKREAARVEQAERRAVQREQRETVPTAEKNGLGQSNSWAIARRGNGGAS